MKTYMILWRPMTVAKNINNGLKHTKTSHLAVCSNSNSIIQLDTQYPK